MYICLEGVKGCGKTTVFETIIKELQGRNVNYATLSPTKKSEKSSILEYFHEKFTFLHKIDFWNEMIYANRSNNAAKSIDWSQNLILGDRSIVTSYVTRWNRWHTPEYCIDRINKKHKFIQAPDIIIYLDISISTVMSRIKLRENRTYGKHDETIERIEEAINSYKKIMDYKIKKLENTQWFIVNAEQSPEQVAGDCLTIIFNALKSKKK